MREVKLRIAAETIVSLIILSLSASGQIVLRSGALDNNQIRRKIIEDSVENYPGTGHPCACPYNSARDGTTCSGRSAYSRPGGAEPFCYPSDVSDQMVSKWKEQHPGQCLNC